MQALTLIETGRSKKVMMKQLKTFHTQRKEKNQFKQYVITVITCIQG